MKRYQIVNKIHQNSEKITALRLANVELNRQNLLLSDKNQQYKESEETFGRGKSKETVLVGRVHWRECFKDEDTDEKIWIDRSCVVRKNNEWVEGY